MKRILLALACWLAFAAPTQAAIARVQNVAGAVSNAFTFGSNLTAGNTIICAVQASGAITGVTGAVNATYTAAITLSDAGSLFFSGIYYFENSGSGAETVTAANSFGASFAHVACGEYSGLATSSSLDKTAAAIGSGGSHSAFDSTATATTSQADELIFGESANFSALTSTWTTPTTEQYDDATAGASRAMSVADQIISSTGAQSSTGSYSSTTVTDQVLIATFKASGAAPTVVYCRRALLGVGC